MAALLLRTPTLFSDKVSGDAEEKGLRVPNLAARLIRRDAQVGFLDDVIHGDDTEAAQTNRKPPGVMTVKLV